jgi:hypothetical protein
LGEIVVDQVWEFSVECSQHGATHRLEVDWITWRELSPRPN